MLSARPFSLLAKFGGAATAAEPLSDPASQPDRLTVIPIREWVLFPKAVLPIAIRRPEDAKAIRELGEGKTLAVFSQRDPKETEGTPASLHAVGTEGLIHKIIDTNDGGTVIFCEGVARIKVAKFLVDVVPWLGQVERLTETPPEMTPEFDALRQNAIQTFQQVIAATPDLSDELQAMAQMIPEPGRQVDFLGAASPGFTPAERQDLLEELDVRHRFEKVNRLLQREFERLQLRHKIHSETQGQLTQTQREIFLREQMKAIQKELGETDETAKDVAELRAKVEAAGMPESIRKEAEREIDRLGRLSVISPEYGMARTYVDWMASLPWSKATGAAVDVQRAAQILDEDHYGLEKVKQRILDYLAVLQLRPSLKGPILCFVGGPGVGKTSLGRSIARALGRQFTRISLGGMHDEAEIRGHRRTYIGSLPGQIIQGLRRAGVNDPVFMLDEIDKMGRGDFHGDPASALLEVLDPEQNFTFRDNYLDVPFDLSHVLFITTANHLDPVADALRDRMEVIELPGYGDSEKHQIAVRYLIPRQIRENGLDSTQIHFHDEAIIDLVRHYTREAGVRNLERTIGNICRKKARRVASGDATPLGVTPAVVAELLGAPPFRTETEVEERTKRPGVAIGLAWTPVGGDVLFVEAGRMAGGAKGLIMTGQLGSVMQESVQAALTWVRTNAADYGIDPELFKASDIHVHVPSGAVPKDGPSAGVTVATALVSALSGRPVRPRLGMTGEVTLGGLVLPVGGIKDKVLAARRSGVTLVLMPAANEADVQQELKAEQLGDIQIRYVRTMEEVIRLALQPPG